MHELSVADALVQLAVTQVPSGCAALEVVVEVGALTGIAPECLAFYYEGLTEGTPLEGSRLVCHRIDASVRCGACSKTYEPDGFARVCKHCGSLGGVVLEGTELNLVRIELGSAAHV